MAQQRLDLGVGPNGPKDVICLACGARNPPKAYCCITCFKVLRAKPKPPLLQLAMRPSVGLIVLFLAILIGGLVAMKHWIDNIENRFVTNDRASKGAISATDQRRREQLGASANPYAEIESEGAGTATAPPAATTAAPPPAQP